MARLQEEDVYRLDIENTLSDFVLSYSYTLPQKVKVIEGFYDEEGSDCEFSCGDVVVLSQVVCPAVTISFCDPSSGIDCKTSVPVTHPTKFYCHPYFGILGHTKGKVIFNTVKDLVDIWPTVAKATKSFYMSNTVNFAEKDRLYLVRLVTRNGLKYLECKHDKTQKLMQLPMGCVGDFVAVKDKKLYTLEEIVYNQPPRQRVLKIAEDAYNRVPVPLPGVPPGFKEDLFMMTPRLMVELHPCDSPGDVSAVPITTPIMVSPREDTYTGAVRMEYPLDYFVSKNPTHIPGLITVTSWQEMTTICDNLGIRPGVKINLHALEDMTKVIAVAAGGNHYAIPLNYGRNLRLMPSQFFGIGEVVECRKMLKVKVIKSSAPVTYAGLWAVKEGDVLRVKNFTPKPFKTGADEIEIIELEMLDPKTNRLLKDISVPSYLDGEYEELLTLDQKDIRRVSNIGHLDFPVPIQFTDSGDPVVDPSLDPVPTHTNMLLTHIIKEKCVIASKKTASGKYTRSFHLPLRTELMLSFEEKLTNKRIPALSVLDSFGEKISEILFEKLKEFECKESEYEVVNEPSPSRPLPMPIKSSGSWRGARVPKPPKIPPSTAPKPKLSRSSSTPSGSRTNPYDELEPPLVPDRKRSNAKTGALRPSPRAPLPTPRGTPPDPDKATVKGETNLYDAIDDDYEIICDYDRMKGDLFGGEKPPVVEIPQDGNVSTFTHHDMLVFLQLLNLPTASAVEFSKSKIDGKAFANFSNEDLERYGLKSPLTTHFRDRSKKALNSVVTML